MIFRRPFSVVLALLALLPAFVATARQAPTSPSANRAPEKPHYATGMVILKLRPEVPNGRARVTFGQSRLDEVMNQIGAFERTPLFPRAPWNAPAPEGIKGEQTVDQGFNRVYVVRYTSPYDAQWVSERLVATGDVDYAEPYFFFTESMQPDDPQAAQQYWLDVIKAQQAWDVTHGDTGVIIAIVDSGVDWAHEDLVDNIYYNPGETGNDGSGNDKRTNGVDDDRDGYIDNWHGWDLVGNVTASELASGNWKPDNDPSPVLMNLPGYTGYHGTTVAGCASASTNNGKGIASPGYNCKILPIKCAADTNIQAVNAGYQGIQYAADAGAHIINCSFGGPGGSGIPQALQDVVDYAGTKGALVIAASGNSSVNTDVQPHWPANLRGVLSVGATGMNDFGDTSFTNSGMTVGVFAPGTNIFTTYPRSQYTGNGITGTSFSSPITSGVAGLVFSVHQDWTPEQIAMQLRVTGDRPKLNGTRFAPHYYRRINAYRAVTINSDLTSTTGPTMPGITLTSFRLNGKTRDTVRSLTDTMRVELTLHNILAPARNLQIDTWPDQMLHAVEPAIVDAIPTGGDATVTLNVEVDANAGEMYSDGYLDLVLRLTQTGFEDVLPVRIPVRLPGFKLQASYGTTATAYATQDVAVASPNVAWAVANVNGTTPAYVKTVNGRSWPSFRTITTSSEPGYCIAAISDQKAWIGTSPTGSAPGVWRTINGGTNWTKVSVSSITPFVNSVYFFDENEGLMLGDPTSGHWGIGRSTDGGATWKAITTPVASGSGEAGWNTSYAALGDNVWFGTNNNRIFRSTDRGLTWKSSQTPAKNSFALAFTSPADGIAVFKRTVVNNAYVGQSMTAVTRDGGATWTEIQLPFGMVADGAAAIPGTQRIMVATESGMLETNDMGATWRLIGAPSVVFNWKQQEVAARYPRNVGIGAAASTDSVGTSVGVFGVDAAGHVFGYTEIPTPPTAAPMDETRATSAHLMQPWPSPTNGTTTIGYELARAGNVSIDLFDAAGRKVRTVFVGARDAGRHAVVLDVSELPAGTYYCVLVTGGSRLSAPVVVVR